MKVFLIISIFIYSQFSYAASSYEWRCETLSLTGLDELPKEASLSLSFNGNKIRISPDIFNKRNNLKESFGNFLNRDQRLFSYDYENCLNELGDFIKNEYGDNAVASFKEHVTSSKFFSNPKKSFLETKFPLKTDGLSEVPKSLEKFCRGDLQAKELFSKSTIDHLLKNSERWTLTHLYSSECLNELIRNLKLDLDTETRTFCEKSSEQICSELKKIREQDISKFSEVIDKYNRTIIDYEESRFKYIAFPNDENNYEDIFLKPNSLCEERFNIYKYKSIKADEFIKNNIDYLANNSNRECLSSFLQNYLSGRVSNLGSPDYQKFCEKVKSEKCKQLDLQKNLIYENYLSLFGKLYGERATNYFAENLACKIDQADPLNSLKKLMEENKNIIDCLPLKDGEFKNKGFLIKRISEKQYDITINVNFKDGSLVGKTKEMEKRVKQCLADVSPYLKGPNGETLNVSVSNNEEVKKIPREIRPMPIEISIEEPGFRSNSRAYESDIDCAIITHETLHTLGLGDEYEEKWKPEIGNFSCRIVPSVPSIMKNHYEAFDLGVPQAVECKCITEFCDTAITSSDQTLVDMYSSPDYFDLLSYEFRGKYCERQDSFKEKYDFSTLKNEDKRSVNLISEEASSFIVRNFYYTDKFPKLGHSVYKCSCVNNDNNCQNELAKAREKIKSQEKTVSRSCPPGSTREKAPALEEMKGNKKLQALGDRKFKKHISPTWDSLIYPNHFDYILNGNCTNGGKRYQECTKKAYSSVECEKVPKECKNDEYFLGIKKK